LHPDLWQREVLRAAVRRILLLCARQVGKSTGAAALALKVAVLEAPATVLIFAPSLRQAVELLRTVRNLHRVLTNPTLLPSRITPWADAQRLEDRRERKAERWYLSIPAQKRENALQMTLDNGSRIISLPASYKTTVGYAAINLLIIDEAARVSDELYHSLTPMLSVARGRVLALSTPFGKRGWFYEAHEDEKADWLRIHVHARDCPRHSARFLEEEERSMGPRWFRQEYCLSFEAMVGAVFDYDAIAEAFQCDAEPLVF